MEGEQIKKTRNYDVRKNRSFDDNHSLQDSSATVQLPQGQQSLGFIQDEFTCGVCHLSSHNFWAFLLHKLEHNVYNGVLIPCCLCQTSLKSPKSAEIHYKCFHNITKISPTRGLDGSFSSKNVQHAVLKSPEETNKTIRKSLKRKRKSTTKPSKSLRKSSEYNSHDTLESAQSPGENSLNNTQSDVQSFTSGTVCERGNVKRGKGRWALSDCQNVNSKHFKEIAKGLQTKTILRNEGSPVREKILSNTVNVHTKSGDCSSDAQKSHPAKKCISLSAAALAKIKKLASIVSARNASKEGMRKIFILCKADKPGMPELQAKGITRAVQDQISSNPMMKDSEVRTCQSENNLVQSKIVPPKIQDASVRNLADVKNFERDFLFQFGMRESVGKNISYMREVYKCLYCESFEKCCLDLLIAHMRDFHEDAVMDRCPSEMVSSAKMKPSTGMASPEITSFQEYRSKLFERKTQDEERKSRLQKEKGLPRHLIGLPCMYCSKRFTTATKLQAHMDRHLNVKRFLCEECGRSFRSWHLLRSHKKDHLNASYGKIKCAFCSFQSGDTSALNKHYRIHPKKSNLCHICGNMYSSLRKHVKVHSLDRPYPCPYKGCTYRFTSEVPCKIHYQAHTAQGQRFSCSKCNSRFSRKHHLLRHLTKVHHESIDIQETLCSEIPDSMQPSSSELMTTDDVHQFDQSATSTEMDEFALAVGQDSIHMSESLH